MSSNYATLDALRLHHTAWRLLRSDHAALVGASFFDNGETNEGSGFVYFGTANGRLVQALQTQNNDVVSNSTPVQPGGNSEQIRSFAVNVLATSQRGRENVRLQVQGCPSGIAFGTASCNQRFSTFLYNGNFANGRLIGANLTSLLTDRVCHHWRIRVQHAPLSANAATLPTTRCLGHGGAWLRMQT